jgi:SAM-dependent methyltransferase
VTPTGDVTGGGRFADEQRLAFGRVAELYDRARPSYPPEALDALISFASLAPSARILEVGAGTGKATELLAERGLRVLALEPSPEMAQVARANCAAYPGVEIVETEFEAWEPGEPLPALFSAQAWHWISPRVRYEKAYQALAPGGTLAAVWTFPDWARCQWRTSLSAAYRAGAPRLVADFPMHPDSEPTRLAGDWHAEIEATAGFTGAEVRTFPWSQRYDSVGYVELLQTHQDHILLPPKQRARLLDAIARRIDEGGGEMEMPFVTQTCLARRT